MQLISMSWRKPSEDMLEMFEELVEEVPFERRKVVGQYTLFHRGHVFTGIIQGDIFLPLHPEKLESLKKENDEA